MKSINELRILKAVYDAAGKAESIEAFREDIAAYVGHAYFAEMSEYDEVTNHLFYSANEAY